METKELGKIESVTFGLCGYQDAQLGIQFTFSGEGWGVSHTEAFWDAKIIESSEHTKWTEEDRDKGYANILRSISKYLKEAKVSEVHKLKGKPVEVTFKDRTLKEWRFLTEVL